MQILHHVTVIVIVSLTAAQALPQSNGALSTMGGQCSNDNDCQGHLKCFQSQCLISAEGPCSGNATCEDDNRLLINIEFDHQNESHCICDPKTTGPSCNCPPKPAFPASWPPTTGKKKFYLVLTTKLEWHGAYMYCIRNNSRLARIENQEDNKIVKKMLDDLDIKYVAAVLREFWIGGTDHADEGHWMWLSTGEPASGFSFWNLGNPNDWGNEDCLSYFEQDPALGYKWNDSICDKKFNFVCEYYD